MITMTVTVDAVAVFLFECIYSTNLNDFISHY